MAQGLTFAVAIAIAVIIDTSASAQNAPFYENKANLLHFIDGDGRPHEIKAIDGWQVRRRHIVANMEKVMGPMPDSSRIVPLDMQVIKEEDMGSYTRKTITIAVEEWDRLPAYLLVPKKIESKAPAMLCLHPTYEFGKNMVVGLGDKPNRNYAEELAQRGYVTLAPDYPGFGEYVDSREALYKNGYVSCTMKAIWNHMRCIDLLQSMPEVAPDRIGAIGHSLGGHNTLYLGVFDPRVRVMVTSCGFNSFHKYYEGNLKGWSHDGYMPRIATEYDLDPAKMPFDFTEVLGALAPRPVFINAPINDANFEVTGVEDCVDAAQPIYHLYSAAENLKAEYPEADHDFPTEQRESAYRFIANAIGTP